MKQWKDYFDEYGLIVGQDYHVSTKDQVQRGDTLQRCGFWALLAFENLDLYELKYLRENFDYDTEEKIAVKFLDMYDKCHPNRNYEDWPIRHPDYYKLGGTGKTSRDQLVSNWWALLKVFILPNIKVNIRFMALQLLEMQWQLLKRDKFILPAGHPIGPQHLSIFIRYFYVSPSVPKWKKAFYYLLMNILDIENVFGSIIKVFESYQRRAHVDDPTRICMVLGASTIIPTPMGKLAAWIYWKFRPAWEPLGTYWHNKPNEEFKRDKKIIGANYAMKYYSEYQEAPWDTFLEPVGKYYYDGISNKVRET